MRQHCSCGFTGWGFGLWSPEWHRHHRAFHFAVYPSSAADAGTVRNLADFIEGAERRALSEAAVS